MTSHVLYSQLLLPIDGAVCLSAIPPFLSPFSRKGKQQLQKITADPKNSSCYLYRLCCVFLTTNDGTRTAKGFEEVHT